MAGMTDVIAAEPAMRLRIVAGRDLGTPAFYHSRVGRNDHPLEKIEDFAAVVAAMGPEPGIAMLKLCYADIHRHTDVDQLFATYRRRVDDLRSRLPALTIVHSTVPLTIVENWKGRLRATLTGAATERQRNAVRQRYNDLMRTAFATREPLFDIARLEATLPDGGRTLFAIAGASAERLAAEYTDDGGHLNARGRRMVAEQLLILLARLPELHGHRADRRE